MRKYIVLIINILFSTTFLYSQQEPIQRLNIKSPEVSAFEKYGEIPVSTYTGIPNISIPIYKVRSGDIELPITLDYHATAIKVEQEATWVGLNWLLNAGGVISTNIPRSFMSAGQWEKLFDKMSYADSRSSDFTQTGQMIKYAGTHEQYSSSRYGRKIFDRQPDSTTDLDISRASYVELIQNGFGGAKSFNANFMGYSFSFIYHPVQQKLIVVGQDNKFLLQSGAGGGTEPYYTLTAPNGVKYSFTETETTTYDGGTPSGMTPLILISYYLTKIESPSGRTIHLRYKKYGGINPIIKATETVYHGYKKKYDFSSPATDDFLDGVVNRKLAPMHYTDNSYLYEIESDDALVRFNVGSRVDIKGTPKKLDNIEIFDKLNGNKRIKRFVFGYDYYTGNNVGGDYILDYYKYIYEGRDFDPTVIKFTSDHLNKRLRLTSLLEEGYGSDGIKVNSAPYKFTYNANTLPGKTSAARDYWGNYNGKENAGGKYYHTLLPDVSHLGENTQDGFPSDFNNKVVKADQRLNPAVISHGLLSSVTYPTGGYSSFSFEPHKVSNYPYSLSSPTENWTVTKSVQTRTTNFDTSLPVDILTKKEFTLTQPTTVTINVEMTNPSSYDWTEMRGSMAYLFKYTNLRDDNGGIVESFTPFKVYVLSDVSDLSSSVTTKKWTETLTLEPGKYRIQANYSGPKITSYEMSQKGRRDVFISVSNSVVDLLSEYKSPSKFTIDTDVDFMYRDVDLTAKEFILKEETGIVCNVSIRTNGNYTWDKMQGSIAYIYKYEETRLSNGSVDEQLVPVKQWGVNDLPLSSDAMMRNKTEIVVLGPGKYRIKTVLSVPGFSGNTPEYINKSGGQISMDTKKYTNTISGETNADAVGVRIATISSYDGIKTQTTKYKYLDKGIPTGIMMNPLKFTRKKYEIFQGEDEIEVSGGCYGPKTAQLINYWVYSSNNMIPQADNSIGYSYVEVIREGSGYETFSHWNKRNYSKDFLKPLPDPRNGNLLENKIYSESGTLLKKLKNKYSILKTESYFVNANIEDVYVGGDSPSRCSPLVNPYASACPYNRALIQIYPSVKYWIEKTEATEMQYFAQDSVSSQSIYTYNPLNLSLASKEQKINNGESDIQYFIYPVDYTASSSTYPGNLVSYNILNPPLEVVNTVKKSSGQFIISGTINKYNSSGQVTSGSNLEFIDNLPVSSFKFSNKTVNGITSSNTGGYTPFSKYIERITCSYTKGNPQYIVKDNNENIVYLWSYNHQYPIAEIKNATYTQVRDALGGQTVVDNIAKSVVLSDADKAKINNLRTNAGLAGAHITTYTYKPLVGMLTATDPAGLTTTYEYDTFGRLIRIKDPAGKIIQSYNYHYQNQ